MHVIDERSPLWAETVESLARAKAALILSLPGTDETTGQTLMARAEYDSGDIRWNESFRVILEVAADGTIHFDYRKFNEVVPLELP